MKKSDYKIHIVGAGISGLIAAQVLENYGYCPVLIDSSKEVGGRVCTEDVEGYQLDVGFQVLLSAYPAAQKYLNYEALHLQKLIPGAVLFSKNGSETIGDPLREPSLLFSTLTSGISISDKLKIIKLAWKLKQTDVSKIFNEEEVATLTFLKKYGFSKDVIHQFFKPFFSGIFLEDQLETSSRMFQFVFKMFAEGTAVIPKGGIHQIPLQLKNNLQNTTFHFQKEVSKVEEGTIYFKDQTTVKSHFTILATDPGSLISNLKNQQIRWIQCDTLYFLSDHKVLKKPIIGLLTNTESLINNIFYPTSIEHNSTGNKKQLLSVTIVKEHSLSLNELVKKVQEELKVHCNIEHTTLLKRYTIKKALPQLTSLHYELDPTETRLSNTIFLAGDYMLNPSLNAAMISGERAALGIIKSLEDGLIVEEFTSEFT